MGFLKKIVRGAKKLASFTGKVVKGAASGGLLGAGKAFVENVGKGKKKKKNNLDAKNIYANSIPGGGKTSSGVRFTQDKFVTS